jgi:hypothetical protein
MYKRIAPVIAPIKQPEAAPPPEPKYLEASFGTWHPKRQYTFSLPGLPYVRTLTTVSTITGCGLVQMYGILSLVAGATPEQLEYIKNVFTTKILPELKVCGAGAIIVTLGRSYYPNEPTILKLGFEKLSEYSNYRHGQDGKYKQRLYILKF